MEQPNTSYIDQLSGDNIEFKQKMIGILKRELPEEITTYQKQMDNNDFLAAAQSVHKLKHKVSILGLEKSYYLAEEYEENLKTNATDLQTDFEALLKAMHNFVATL